MTDLSGLDTELRRLARQINTATEDELDAIAIKMQAIVETLEDDRRRDLYRREITRLTGSGTT